MLEVVGSVLIGTVLGLSLAAPPGPMNAVIAEESVLRGWFAGVKAGLGAMTADICFFVLAFAGVVAFIQNTPTLRFAMVGVGGVLMLYFAYGAAANASDTFTTETTDDGKGFQKAFALALTNPFQVIWWLTAGVGLLNPGTIELFGNPLVTTGGPAILIGFFGGIGLWVAGFPAALVTAGRRMDSFAPLVAYLSAILLALFGVSFLYRSFEGALSTFA